MTFKAAVIGCGRVGSLYDRGRDRGNPYSHAGAYLECPDTELIGGVDPSPAQRAAFQEQWGRPAFATVDELMRCARPDIWSIATPVEEHCQGVVRALEEGARGIWCEKPIATSSGEGQTMVRLASSAGVPLALNYLRRWDPAHQRLAQWIRQGKLGQVQHVSVHYTRGLRNYGTHAVDLLRWLIGEFTWVWGQAGWDRQDSDPSPAAMFGFVQESIGALLPVQRAAYDLFEVNLFGSTGRVTLRRSGEQIVFQPFTVDSGSVPGPATPEVEPFGRGLQAMMTGAAQNIVGAVREGAPLLCSGSDGVAALRVVEAIEASVTSGIRTPIKEGT